MIVRVLVLALWVSIFVLSVPVGADVSVRGGWRDVASLPVAVPDARAAYMDGEIYVLSGSVGRGLRRFFEVYDVRGDGWRPLVPLPVDILSFSMTAAGDRLFVIGGRDVLGGALVAQVWAYIPAISVWVSLGMLPEPRAGHASVQIDDALYVFGGDTIADGKASPARDILRYDLLHRTWLRIGKLPIAMRDIAIAVSDGKVFLAGGRNMGGDLKTVYTFDPSQGERRQWTRLSDLPYAVSGGALAQLSDGLHFVGGFSSMTHEVRAQHFSLAPGMRGWQARADLPQGRHRMATAVVDDQFYIIGGALGGGFYALFTASDTVHVYDLE